MKPKIKNILGCIILLFALYYCNPFSKSWDKIYDDQQKLFAENRQVFEQSIVYLNTSNLLDTTSRITDKGLNLPDSLIQKLKHLGIAEIMIQSQQCVTNEIRFIPDSLWDYDRFSVCEIHYNKCDNRSKQGFHWMLQGSEHKHSFGQGNGWLIYTDSDLF